jgi:hypothetical protein
MKNLRQHSKYCKDSQIWGFYRRCV